MHDSVIFQCALLIDLRPLVCLDPPHPRRLIFGIIRTINFFSVNNRERDACGSWIVAGFVTDIVFMDCGISTAGVLYAFLHFRGGTLLSRLYCKSSF